MEEFLSNYTIKEEIKDLPLLHTTKVYNLDSILKNKGLAPTKIDTLFNEKLLFFFYGRAVYAPHFEKDEKINVLRSKEAPIIFMFDLNDIEAKHIFGFDTGGYVNKKHKNKYVGAKELNDINLFDLKNKLNIKKMIDYCYIKERVYTKNYSYYHELPIDYNKLSIEDDNLSSIAIKKYIECLNVGNDRRNKTPEISTDKEININKAKFILAPSILEDEEDLKNEWEKFLKMFNIEPDKVDYYCAFGNYDSNSLCTAAEIEMNKILKKMGYVA